MMSSLVCLVVRRRRAVIMIWIVLLIGAGKIGSSAFSVLSSTERLRATFSSAGLRATR
jgi:hypothetical protein